MLEHFGIKDFIDILLVAALLYYLFKMVKISGMRPL
ncbi:MAG: TIGR00159 family protein, partial [Petrimonas sp.]|nr:TIGR00159 family protein [Petrimonas sp.]